MARQIKKSCASPICFHVKPPATSHIAGCLPCCTRPLQVLRAAWTFEPNSYGEMYCSFAALKPVIFVIFLVIQYYIYIYIYVYIYMIYIYIYIYVYIYVYTYIYIYIYILNGVIINHKWGYFNHLYITGKLCGTACECVCNYMYIYI